MAISNPEFINEVLRFTNEYRAQIGLAPLKINEELNYAAQLYSEELAVRDVGLDHHLDGSDPKSRAGAVGYEATDVSENLWSFSEEPTLELAAKAVADWITSDGHRAQLENPAFTEMGLGVGYRADDNPGSTPDSPDQDTYWTQMFGTGDTNPNTNVPQPPQPSKGDYQAMLDALSVRESGLPVGDPGQYTIENDLVYMGKYQFGELLLIDLGYYKADGTPVPDTTTPNDWTGEWTGKGGVDSKDEFKASPQIQETAIREAFAKNLKYLDDALTKEGKSVEEYIGQVKTFAGKTITISLSGLLAGAHLLGSTTVTNLLLDKPVEDSKDALGTKVTDYMEEFGGYTLTREEVLSVTPPPIIEQPLPEQPLPEQPLPEQPLPEQPLPEQPLPEQPLPEQPLPEQPPSPTDGDDVLVSPSDQGSSVFGLAGNDKITGGLGNDTLDGGAGDDFLSGSAGNDALIGQAGNDTMEGGLGDDSYTVESSSDIVTEAINQGVDTVLASTNYTLSDNVENLTLIGDSAVNGTGNSLDNVMIGNSANNYLYAGDGKDQVEGQAGDDYLYGQAGDDLLSGGEGTDWLVGDIGDDIISGGAGNDRLLGGLGNDTLTGHQGRDRLTGGADADRFVLNSLDKNFDIITDFKAAQGDKIVVSIEELGGNLKQGNLAAARFTLGSTTDHTKSDFVYDKPSGRLFFDADGMGGQKQMLIAKLAAGTTLTNGHIFVSA